MRVLVVGGGAREHIIAERVANEGHDVYAFLKNENPGILSVAKEARIAEERNISELTEFAKRRRIDFAIIGPEDPLEAGISDELSSAGVLCYGPKSSAARIETSKAFARQLMLRHRIPGSPEFRIFDTPGDAIDFVKACDFSVVVKPSGLTGGKGVKVEGEHLSGKGEVCRYITEIFEEKIGGERKVVIEERLEGEEFSVQAIFDGRHLLPLPLVQDHKRAYEGDKGPNTGGMGSYSMSDGLLPFVREKERERALEIMKRVVDAMKEEGDEFRGTLYGGFMLTSGGIKLLEFNARFGDPEVMNVLSVTRGEFVDTLYSAAEGNLKASIDFENSATLCRYYVPVGYGSKPLAGAEITVDEACIRESGCHLYYASVRKKDGKISTTSSRSFALVSKAEEPWLAIPAIEKAGHCVSGMVYTRKDIGTAEEIEQRRRNGEKLRRG